MITLDYAYELWITKGGKLFTFSDFVEYKKRKGFIII